MFFCRLYFSFVLFVPHWDSVGFAISQFGLSQIKKLSLKTLIKGNQQHPNLDYPVSQAAPEVHRQKIVRYQIAEGYINEIKY